MEFSLKFGFLIFMAFSSGLASDRFPASENGISQALNRDDLAINQVFQRPDGMKHNQIFMSTSRAVAAMLVLPDGLENYKRELQEAQSDWTRTKRYSFLSEDERSNYIKSIRNNKQIPIEKRRLRIIEASRAPLYQSKAAWQAEVERTHSNYDRSHRSLLRASARRGFLPKASGYLRNATVAWFLTELLVYGVGVELFDLDTAVTSSFTGIRYYVKLRDKERLAQDIDALGAYYEVVREAR